MLVVLCVWTVERGVQISALRVFFTLGFWHSCWCVGLLLLAHRSGVDPDSISGLYLGWETDI